MAAYLITGRAWIGALGKNIEATPDEPEVVELPAGVTPHPSWREVPTEEVPVPTEEVRRGRR